MKRYKRKFEEANTDWDQLIVKINSYKKLLTTNLYLTHSPNIYYGFSKSSNIDTGNANITIKEGTSIINFSRKVFKYWEIVSIDQNTLYIYSDQGLCMKLKFN
jgi:hypothetical protein